MNREDELFDDFLRSKLGSKEFTNKPHYWEGAREMIAAERKSDSFRPIIFGSVVLLAVIGLGFLFNTRSNTSSANNNTLTASSVPVGTSTTSTYTVQATPVQGVAQTDFNTPATASSNKEQMQQPEQSTTAASPVVASTDRTPKHPGRGNKNSRHAAGTRKPSPADERSGNTSVVFQSNQQVTDINGRTYYTPLAVSAATTPSYNKTSAYIKHAADAQRSFLAIEAGINSYNPGSNGMINSVNGQIGIRYYRYLGPKFALSSGLTYARLHQSLPARSFESTDYDFGQNASSTTISTQRLDYIELPVSALYHLAPKHAIMGGVAVGYVIGSHDKITDAGGNQTYDHGYLNAINRWDAQVDLGYQYMISQRFRIRASYHMGLMDISNNTLFKQSETHTNKGLRVTLGYTIF
jgi:hypothetical protein